MQATMMKFFSFVMCLLLVLGLGTALITLDVENRKPLEQQTSERFALQLHFDPLILPTEDIRESKGCIKINGDICQCFDTNIQDTSFYLTEVCLEAVAVVCGKEMECDYWFSVYLMLPMLSNQQLSIGKDIKRTIDTSAVHIVSRANLESLITIVLPLTLDDLSRVSVLLHTLQYIPNHTVHELLVFVPDSQHQLVQAAIQGIASSLALHFVVRVVAESSLFARGTEVAKHAYPYAIQMAIKLLAARLVHTPHYITLDADVVLLRPFTLQNLIQNKRAIYHFEERSVHQNWWRGSEKLLNLSLESSYKYHIWQQRDMCIQNVSNCINRVPGLTQSEEQGFGVTPAVMSTFGSLLTVSFICQQLLDGVGGASSYHRKLFLLKERIECERRWIEGFGRYYHENDKRDEAPSVVLWSEYTLYRIVLDHLQVFDELHVREASQPTTQMDGRIIYDSTILHCYNVWYEAQLPWQAEQARAAENCLFSVIQSTTGVSPSLVYKQYKAYFA